MGSFRPFTDAWGWKAHFIGEWMADAGAPRDEVDAARDKIVREGIAAQAEKPLKRKPRNTPRNRR